MKAVVFINIGSPDKPEAEAVGKYLRQFLMDKHVLDIPYIARLMLVNGIIVPFRKKHSAELYRSVWTEGGAPLKVIQHKLIEKVSHHFNPEEVYITQAMRYGNPSIKQVIKELAHKNTTDILFFLLYPQNTGSTVKSAKEEILKNISLHSANSNITFIDSFYEDIDYLSCLTASVKEAYQAFPLTRKLIFTYHGVPVSHLPCPRDIAKECNTEWGGCKWNHPEHKTCYRFQCYRTTEAIAESLHIKPDDYIHCFQSRLGKGEWLKPYLSEEIQALPAKGISKVMILAPSFLTDCLETYSEINIEIRELFLKNGGSDFFYLPCLNDRTDWSIVICQWIKCWLNNSDISKSRVSL